MASPSLQGIRKNRARVDVAHGIDLALRG